MGSPVLDVDGVSLWLSGRKVLDDVSFSLAPGEFAGLIGSNGAGKTTLLRVILGLQAPSAGTVRVAGQPRTRRGSLIGYVPQKILLDPDMPLRARDLVGLGLDGQRLGIPLPSARRRHQIDEMLQAVDAARFADTRVGLLSGGEQQRVLIAHALISRPRLLLLDEPLANLDIASEQDVVELLGRVAREQQVAVLISAHDMNPLLPVMDRIVYMAAGRAASGTTAEVVRPEVLSDLYGQHVDVIRVHNRILVVAAQRGEGLDVPALRTRARGSRGRVMLQRGLRARLLLQQPGARRPGRGRGRRAGVRDRRLVRRGPRPVLRGPRAGRHQRDRRLGLVPGRGQPAVGIRRRRRAGGRGDGHDRDPAAPGPGPGHRHRPRGRRSAWPHCSSTGTRRTATSPGPRSRSCSAPCSRSAAPSCRPSWG